MASILPDWRRANSWFAVVSADTAPLVPLEPAAQDDPDGHPLDLRYRASLLDRFPLQDNQESRIENGIADFCFPDGLKLSRGMVMPKFFCFVLTDGEGTRAYGSCLTIYELLPEDAESELQEKVAAWEARQAEATPPLRREDGKMAAYFAAGGLEAGEEDDARSSGSGSSSEVGNVYGRAGGEDEKEARAAAVEGIYLPRCLCVLSKYPFVNTTRAWLMQLYRLSLSPTPVPLERYISNFLLEVPAPVPGRMGVQLQMLDQSLDYPCPPPHEPLAWSGLPFESVLEMAAPEALLGAFGCVLLEQQLLLHSSSLSLLTATAEFLVACLYPLTWCHVYIPVLPRHCLYIPLNSPVPFILGTSTASYRSVASQLPETVTVLDLDKSALHPAPGLTLPPLPERRRAKLLKAFKEHAPLFIGGVEEEEGEGDRRRHWQRRRRGSMPTSPIPFLSPAGAGAATTSPTTATVPSPSSPAQQQPPPLQATSPPPSAGEAPATPSHKEAAARRLRAEARRRRRARLRALDDPFTMAGRQLEEEEEEAAAEVGEGLRGGARANWEGVKDALLGCMVALLKDYRRFLVLPTKEDPKPRQAFRVADFLATQPAEWGSFLEELVKTQAFQSFIDVSRLAPGAEDPEGAAALLLGDDAGAVAYFDEVLAEVRQHRSRFSLGGANRNQPSFRRPGWRGGKGGGGGGRGSEDGEVKTVVALQPDVRGLPPEPFVYTGFPDLQERWYAPPRPVSEEVASLGDDRHGNSGRHRRKGGGPRRKNAILRFNSDHVPSNPTTLVFSVFETAFAQTIGRDLHEGSGGSGCCGAAGTVSAATAAVVGAAMAPSTSPLDASLPAAAPSRQQEEVKEKGPEGAGEEEAGGRAASPDLAKGIGEVSLASLPRLGSEKDIPEKDAATVAARASPPLALRRSSSVARLRPKMRRLSEDLKEEKVHVANRKLSVAFDVLQRMRAQRVPADEWTYRSLIDAAGRLGNVDLALRAVTEMNGAGFPVDASVLSCLVAAFARSDKTAGSAASQASQALALLEWSNKVRRGGGGGGGGSASLGAKDGIGGGWELGGGGSGSNGLSSAHKLNLRMSGTPKMMKDLFRKMGGGGGGAGAGAHAGASTPGSAAAAKGTSHGSSSSKGGGEAVSRNSSLESDGAPLFTPPTTSRLPISVSRSLDASSSSTTTGTPVSSNPAFEWELDESALRDAEEAPQHGRPRSVRPSNAGVHLNTPLVKYQVLYSESLLGLLFPGLALDVDSETCPECSATLTAAQVAAGFRPDANDYTTVCPLCTAARELQAKRQLQEYHQQQQQQQAAAQHGGLHALDLGLFPAERERRPTSLKLPPPPPPPPVRRFVARFSVKCAAPDWVGSMGPGSPLWCEYLSPWVLRKEVQNILLTDGIEALTAPEFRKVGASATIFWNLILWLHFSYALPVAFLLQESADRLQQAQGAAAAASPSSSSATAVGKAPSH